MPKGRSHRWFHRALVAVALVPGALGAATIVRGPYLQRISDREAIVRWRTDAAVESRLWWGAEAGNLPNTDFSAAPTTEHRRVVSGLSPRELVYYAVGDATGVLAGADEDHRFRAARSPGDWGGTRIWVLGDSGTANADAAAVRDGFFTFAEGVMPDFWMMLGDNAYASGSDSEYEAAVFDMYPSVLERCALWPVFGNHDAVSSDSATLSGPYFASFSLPRNAEAGGFASQTEAYYSFDAGQVHVVVLDSADSPLAPDAAMLTWLDADLAANGLPWTIAAIHHPPYTKGSHDSDDPADSGGRMIAMRQSALPILEAHGVDLVLSGHSHGYERTFLIDGHYGLSTSFLPSMLVQGGDGDPDGDGPYLKSPGPHGGTVYVVAGSSGKVEGTIEAMSAMAVGIPALGSLVIDVHDNVLDGRFVTTAGAVADHFQILDGDLVFADGFESGDPSAWSP